MRREIEHRTKRRTKAEIELADKIAKLAAKKKPDPNKMARAARMTAAAKKSPRFEYNRGFSVIDDLPIHYFHDRGESVVGILGEPGEEMWRGSTYPLVLDTGRIIRLPGNRLLHKAIQTGDFVGQRVKITYEGKHYYRYGGHYQKVYSVELAPITDPRAPMSKTAAKAFAEAAAKKEGKGK